jgi:tetratricopeptide (TPR) repeat protein
MDGRAIPGGASRARVTRSAHERHGRWYARLGSEDAIEALDRHEGIQRRHALEQELENLIAACRRSASRGDGPQATAHYRAAWAVLEGRGPLDLAVDLGTAVLGVKLEPVDRARVLDTLGQAEWRSGRLDEARAHCEAALAIHQGLRDTRSEGRTLRRLGELLRERGRSEEARTLIEAALDVARRVGDRQTEALALNSLGNFHRDEVDVSGLRYQEALAIFRAIGDRSWEGAVLGNLGFLRFEQGLVEEARAMMEAALAICRETGDRYREGVVLGNFGLVNHEAGRHDEARACLDAALALLGETGHRRFAGFYLGVLGNLDRDQGRLNEARDRLEKAIAMLGEMGSRGDEGIIQGFLGDLHLQEGRRDEAGRALARGESLLRGEVDQFFLGRLLCTRARFDLQCGDAAGARSRMDEVRAIAARIGAGPDSPLRHDLARLDQALELAP